jgi:hypothetical protein
MSCLWRATAFCQLSSRRQKSPKRSRFQRVMLVMYSHLRSDPHSSFAIFVTTPRSSSKSQATIGSSIRCGESSRQCHSQSCSRLEESVTHRNVQRSGSSAEEHARRGDMGKCRYLVRCWRLGVAQRQRVGGLIPVYSPPLFSLDHHTPTDLLVA